jgi:hypothetical protein
MNQGSRPTVKLQLRLPRQEHQRLTRAARRALRSLNSEILHRLKQSFEPAQASDKPAAG